jgi:hypothetical protein
VDRVSRGHHGPRRWRRRCEVVLASQPDQADGDTVLAERSLCAHRARARERQPRVLDPQPHEVDPGSPNLSCQRAIVVFSRCEDRPIAGVALSTAEAGRARQALQRRLGEHRSKRHPGVFHAGAPLSRHRGLPLAIARTHNGQRNPRCRRRAVHQHARSVLLGPSSQSEASVISGEQPTRPSAPRNKPHLVVVSNQPSRPTPRTELAHLCG